MRMLTLLLAFCVTGQGFAQTTLTGYVTLQNSGNRSAFPAQVKSWGATTTDIDSNEGSFSLIFDRKKPGQDALLEIIKAGFEVVNREDLFILLPTTSKAQRPVKLFLCPQGQWQHYAGQYYKINIEAINQTYESELARIKKQFQSVSVENEAYRKVLAELGEARKSAEAQAQALAEKFARANLDDATERYIKAYHLFTAGQIDSVLALLNEREILADIERAKLELAQGKELIQIGQNKQINGLEAKDKIIAELMIKARAHVIRFQWKDAERTYEIAVRADSLNIKNLPEYALFLTKQNQFEKAERWWKKCLALSKNGSEEATWHYNLGMLYQSKKDLPNAQFAFQKALDGFQKISEVHSKPLQPYLAATYNGLGMLLSTKKDHINAKNAYQRSLAIYREVVKTDSIYRSELAMVLNNLGNLLRDEKDFSGAESAYKEALAVFDDLSMHSKNIDYLGYTAWSYNGLGVLYNAQLLYSRADSAFQNALSLYKRLAVINPESYESSVAMVQNNLGGMYLTINKLPESEIAFLEALKIQRPLAALNPTTYAVELATTLNNLGALYRTKNDFSKAEAMLLEVLDNSEKMNPIFILEIARAQNNLGNIYRDIGALPKAKAMLLDATESYASLARDNPEVFDSELAIAQMNLGTVYFGLNESGKAEQEFFKVLETEQRLVKDNPAVFSVSLADTYTNLGLLYSANNEFEKSKSAFEKAYTIYHQLAEKDANNYTLGLCRILIGMSYQTQMQMIATRDTSLRGKCLALLQEATERMKIYQMDLPLLQNFRRNIDLIARQVVVYDPILYLLEIELPGWETAVQNEPTARGKVSLQQNIVSNLKKIFRRNPANLQLKTALANSYGGLAWYLLFTKKYKRAERFARKGLLTDAAQSWINSNLALALLFQGKWEAAENVYQTWRNRPYDDKRTWKAVFLDDLNALHAAGIDHPDVPRARALINLPDSNSY